MRERVRVLIIEDKADLAADAKREIEEVFQLDGKIDIEVSVETDFDIGFEIFCRGESDVVVLDVRRDLPVPADDEAGHNVYRQIKQARFAPVVFWTALPEDVAAEAMPPLVTVLTKSDTDKLPAAIMAAVSSRAVSTIGDIERHVGKVLREHMWSELAPNWAEYTEDSPADIAQVLISRLARVLEDDHGTIANRPSHRYIYPPTAAHAPGDILSAVDGSWWITLTPSCDFAQNKVGFVLLARAIPLEDHEKYGAWKRKYIADKAEDKQESKRAREEWNNLRRDVLASTRGRYHYLPRFREIPDLVIDLENSRAEEETSLAGYKRIASLASPFAESLLVQHSHHRGRIGVPDIDSALIEKRLAGPL